MREEGRAKVVGRRQLAREGCLLGGGRWAVKS